MSDINRNHRSRGIIPFPDAEARKALEQKRGIPPSSPTDNKIVIREYDHVIFIATIILVAFGLVMVFSASYYAAMHSGAGAYSFFRNQAMAAAGGLVFMVIAATVNYRMLARFSGLLYAMAIVLLGLVFTPMGVEHNGALRWVAFGDFNFQPSEAAKLATIVMLSVYISKDVNRVNNIRGLLGCALIVGLPVMLVAMGRNLSTVIILGVIGFAIIFLASPYFWRFAVGVAAAAAGAAAYIAFGAEFRRARIDAWLDPFSDPSGVGFQTIQSLYAVASGGFFGLGLGNSIQKRYFLPEAQNDFIFAIIVEELGLFGAGIVLMLFAVLVWRGMRVAMNSRSMLGCLMATGIVTMISAQVIINVGVVTNTIPNTGIPLPFISFGGTSLVVMMTAVGILLNISRYQKAADKGRT